MGAKKKLAALLVVATTGVTAALFFRKDGAVEQVQSGGTDELKLSEPIQRRVTAPSGSLDAGNLRADRPRRAGKANALQAPTVATGTSARVRPDDPPELPTGYRQAFSRASAVADLSFGNDGDEAVDVESSGTGPERTHVIVDGDTLSKLAQRYLHSGDRYLEIFELNRDVLSNPELLPIGKSLKIPRPSAVSLQGTPLAPSETEPRLVPIPKEKLRRGAL